MVKIEIDQGSGFCFGVVNAIKKAEEELEKGETLYCLGDIVHNNHEVERLKAKGLITINHEQFRQLRHKKVLLRAHGEPPETYETARKNDIKIIDATCPVVLQLQSKIKKSYDAASPEQTQIVIYGKPGHAEVNGLVGQTSGQALIVEHTGDLEKIDFEKEILLYSQTTKSVDEFKKIVAEITRKQAPGKRFEYYDTICRQVANRIPGIREFVCQHDLVLFVCGEKSSNGRVLYGECCQINPNTRFVSHISEIKDEWISGTISSIGICGATSTPKWLMEEVSEYLSEKLKNKTETK